MLTNLKLNKISGPQVFMAHIIHLIIEQQDIRRDVSIEALITVNSRIKMHIEIVCAWPVRQEIWNQLNHNI